MVQSRETLPPTTPQQYATEITEAACRKVFDIECTPEVTPADPQFGDFATNIAMQLRHRVSGESRDIAQRIAREVEKSDHAASAEVAGPGFINIAFTEEYWLDIAERLPVFIQPAADKKHKVQVEFISANPTGPLTLGNARGGFIGDVISSVLTHQGHEVTREYYFNDGGVQIDKLLESVRAEAGLTTVEERQYGGTYIAELAEDFKQELQSEDDEILKRILTEAIFERHIKPDINKMNIEFDVWFNETRLMEDGTFDQTTDLLKERNLLFERDGAQWLDTGRGGDSRGERVFIKSDGMPTYFAPDVAYHVNIFRNRGFDMAIKELGPDHIAQFPSVHAVIKLLFPDKELKMVGHQQMRLIRDGREVKMSKRRGQVVTVGELIDEVGPDVARWFMLMRGNDTHMDFDLDLAVEQSQKNPFWYVMYAYVRAQAIQREASERGIDPAHTMTRLNETEHAMVKKLSRLPDLLDEIERNYEVHHLTFYGRELAKLFHDWYETVRVVELPDQEAAEKLLLLERFSAVMRQYFAILGIEPYERM